MTVADDGVDRLIHFVDERLAQLQIRREEMARRGGPSYDALTKIRGRSTQNTPRVSTLLRLDGALGWQLGSSAVVLLGGTPLIVTARVRRTARLKRQAAQPVTAEEIMHRLVAQVHDEIARLHSAHTAIGQRIQGLQAVVDRMLKELTVDDDLVAEFSDDVLRA
jgi:hypothetical protein